MKSKILALSKNEEFRKLLQQKKVSNKYVTIFFGYLNDKNKNSLNISFVTKKKIGNAVKRNKAKRIMRELARKIIINGKINSYYVLIAKTSLLEEKFEKLLLELKEKAND